MKKTLFSPDYKRSISYLGKWTVIALLSGVIGSVMIQGFNFAINFSTSRLTALPGIPPLWTLAGALVCGLLIYRLAPGASGEGIPSYIQALMGNKGRLNPRDTLFKFWAALFTLGTFGNGGIIGPIGRVVAGVMSFFTSRLRRLKFRERDIRTAAICGLAATVGAVFHSAVGGGIFAVEIIQRQNMRYRDLFPAILSSSIAVFVCKAFGWSSFYPIEAVQQFMSLQRVWIFLLFALFIGLAGKGFIDLYGFVSRLFKRESGRNLLPKVLIGSAVAGGLVWLLNPEVMGTSQKLISALFTQDIGPLFLRFDGRIPIALTLLILAVLKGAGNCITVGSGMSAGFAGPAIIIGMLLGAACSYLFGITPGSADYYALLAAGFAGMLASVMNIPIAAAVLTLETFGLEYGFPAAVAAIIAFQINRHETIYDFARQKQQERISGNDE